MVYFRECPRCHGDMDVRDDIYGQYKECLQCGYMQDLAQQHPEKFPNWAAARRKAGRDWQAA